MSDKMSKYYRNDRDPMSLARAFFGFDPFFATQSRTQKSAFVPAFEAKETENAYVISGDIPGISDKDIDISMHNNVLTIAGSRAVGSKQEGDTYFLVERQYGSFTRSFSLPDAADGDAIEAQLQDGVLTLTIGKKAESMPRKIALKK